MSGCFTWIGAIAALVLGITSMIRWFEQVSEAVDNGWWNKLFVLIVVPPSVWFFPSRVSAGRPIPVPLHQPVMGMGAAPKLKTDDAPPPGTPKEFMGMPVIRTKKPGAKRTAVDPEKLAKLKQK